MCHTESNKEPDGESAAHTTAASLLQPRKAGECLGPQCAFLEGVVLMLHLNKLSFLFCQLEGKVAARGSGLIPLTSVKACFACFSCRLISSAFIYT